MTTGPKKKYPTGHVVLATATQAPRVHAAEGKFALMKRFREASREGEDVAALLLKVMRNGTDRDALEAAKIFLAYGWGKPVETQITADLSPPNTAPEVAKKLTTAQLEEMVTGALPGKIGPEVDGELVSTSEPEEPTGDDS